jgi:predicted small secreted protein
MQSKIKTATIITLTALAVLASGCNTVQGVGDDLKSAGKKGEEVIKK